jgi:hypothetical protein
MVCAFSLLISQNELKMNRMVIIGECILFFTLLHLPVLNAQSLGPADINGFADPYVVATFEGQTKRTNVKKKT